MHPLNRHSTRSSSCGGRTSRNRWKRSCYRGWLEDLDRFAFNSKDSYSLVVSFLRVQTRLEVSGAARNALPLAVHKCRSLRELDIDDGEVAARPSASQLVALIKHNARVLTRIDTKRRSPCCSPRRSARSFGDSRGLPMELTSTLSNCCEYFMI